MKRPFYKIADRLLTMPDDDAERSESGNLLVIPWLDATIKWSKDHPVRHALWRVYVNLTISPATHYRQHIYWPIRTFYERGRRGWSERDLWSFDHYLSDVIADGVDRLREIGHGWPGDPMTPEEWNGDGGILDKIATAFRAHSSICNMDFVPDDDYRDYAKYNLEEERLRAQVDEGLQLFVKWYGSLWD